MTLVVLALAWLAAIVLVATWSAPGWAMAGLLGALLPGAWLLRRRLVPLLTVAALVALAGGLRFESWQGREAGPLHDLVGRVLSVEGTIDSAPRPGETSQSYEVAVQRLRVEGQWVPLQDRLLATLSQYQRLLPGTSVRLTGQLREPPVFPDFDYRGFLERRDIRGTMLFPEIERLAPPGRLDPWRVATELRLDLEDALGRSLPEPEASLAAGIAVGRDGNLPDDLYADYRNAGVAHIVAVSGTNVAIIAALVFLAAVPLVGRRVALVPAVAAVAGYVVLAGASGSVLRAGLMACVYLVGESLGRPRSSLAALALTAIAITGVQPSAALDVGFQLSLAATAGLIVFAPWVRWCLEWSTARSRYLGWFPRPGSALLAMTLAATAATLPVTWVAFGRVSLVGPLANLVVEPLFLAAFLLSLLTGVAGLAWEPAGWALGLVAYFPLAAISWLASAFAAIPFASVSLPTASSGMALALGVALIGVGCFAYLRLPPELPPRPLAERPGSLRLVPVGAFSAVALVLFVRTSLLPLGGPGELEVDILDVGQGDAILLTTPHGRRVLVDGGPSGIVLARQLGAVLPHWDRAIDRVVLTHPQQDHLGGIPLLLDRFETDWVADNGVRATSEAWDAIVAQAGDRRHTLRAGDEFTLDGVRFEVLWPPASYQASNPNDSSIVLLVTYGDVRLLLTGDLEAAAQERLLAASDVHAAVLKVPHHGGGTSSARFLAAVAPSVAAVSVGVNNTFGHPSPETLAALGQAVVLRTDLDGRITLTTDGHSLQVATSR